jgi:threonine/homoserine/homoserine lactone efflux protein
MEAAHGLFAAGVVLLLGAMSPGPSTLLVMRATLENRRAGLAAAIGMGAGSIILASLAMLGLRGLLDAAPDLLRVLRLAGACYLLFLAWRMWRSDGFALEESRQTGSTTNSGWRVGSTAVGAQLSNPKTLVVYASVFATTAPADPPGWWPFAVVLVVGSIEVGWYSVVALALSAQGLRVAYLRRRRVIDRAMAVALSGLAVRVALAGEAL